MRRRPRTAGRGPRPTRAVGHVLAVALLFWAAACEFLTGSEYTSPMVYEAAGVDVYEQTEDWTPVPITYVEAHVIGINTGRDTLLVSMPDCILDLEAFASGAPEESAPAWRLRNRLDWPGGIPSGCLRGISESLGPGDTLRLTSHEIPLAEILADSLPSGPYRFRVRLEGTVTRGASERIESHVVDLGAVSLPTGRHPLSLGTYPRDGFHYRVEVFEGADPNEDGRVRLTVTHSGITDSRLTRELRLYCPVRLLAFREAEEREQVPVPAPVWRSPGRIPPCADGTSPVRLGPGEVATFDYAIPSVRFRASGLPIAEAFFLAVIDVDGRPIRLAVDPG